MKHRGEDPNGGRSWVWAQVARSALQRSKDNPSSSEKGRKKERMKKQI